MIRTGFEDVIGQRTSDLFSISAKKAGMVKAIDAKGVVVEYEDGSIKGYELGRRFGSAAGLTIPHNIVTNLKVGDKFEIGDALIYNDGFFEIDNFNPKRVTFKNSFYARTVLWESTQTLEDASSISMRIANKLMTRITKVKTVVVNFDQGVNNLIKVGAKVDYDTVLCIIQDAFSANSNIFDDESIETLKVVGSQTPRAGVKGVIERVEIYYHGDVEDMSESLATLAVVGDKQMKDRAKSMGKKAYTGSVDSGFRIEGDPLTLDCMAIKIYMTAEAPAGVGDKGVIGNQLKTVFSEVLEEDYRTEDGKVLDVIFGAQSVDARIVNSTYDIGTTSTLLKVLAEKMIEAYDN